MVGNFITEIAKGVGSTIGSVAQGIGQVKGARAAQAAIDEGQAYNESFMSDAYDTQKDLYGNYIDTGDRALTDYENFRMREADPYEAQTFSGVDMAEDPGVDYRMNQAVKALDSSAGAKGMLFSGAQQKALQANSQDLASQEYSNAYNRQYGQFSDEENNRYNQYSDDATRNMNYDNYRMGQLSNLVNTGTNATNSLASTKANMDSNQLSNYMLMQGNEADVASARAAAPWMAAGSAIAGGQELASNMGSYYQNSNNVPSYSSNSGSNDSSDSSGMQQMSMASYTPQQTSYSMAGYDNNLGSLGSYSNGYNGYSGSTDNLTLTSDYFNSK